MNVSAHRAFYEGTIYPMMHAHQSAWLVPGSCVGAHFGPALCAVPRRCAVPQRRAVPRRLSQLVVTSTSFYGRYSTAHGREKSVWCCGGSTAADCDACIVQRTQDFWAWAQSDHRVTGLGGHRLTGSML